MRRALAVAVAVAAAALLALLPPAGAQAVPDGTCGPIALNVGPAEVDVEAGSQVLLDGRVENDGNLDATAELRVDDASLPEGWSAVLEPADMSVASGATAAFQLAVRPPTDATTAETVTVVGVLRCEGVQVLTSRAASSTATVTPTPPQGGLGDIGEAAGTYGPIVLGVVVVGGFAAAAVVGSGRLRVVGFVVECPEPKKRLRPGRGTSFPLEIANRGRGPDTAHFLVGEVPEGWTAFTALPEFALGAGEKRALWLMVRAPEDADDGERARIEVTVRSDAHPDRVVTRTVEAEVRRQAPAEDEGDVAAGVGP